LGFVLDNARIWTLAVKKDAFEKLEKKSFELSYIGFSYIISACLNTQNTKNDEKSATNEYNISNGLQ